MKTTSTTALTNDEYRSTPHWSNSDLSNINQSPAIHEWNKNNPAPGSDSVDLGTHLHCALLEPDVFANDYVKMPEFDGRTNQGKASKKAFIDTMAHSNKIALEHDVYEAVMAMRDSALAHPVACKLLTASGQSEVSIFSEINGLKVKCRPDRIPDPEHFGSILVDVKKCASIEEFAKSVVKFRYHVQDSFYSDIHKRLTGVLPRFVFIVVGEKKSIGRHPVRVWELPDDIKERGRSTYLSDLEAAREYMDFGCGLDIEQLHIPEYLLR